MGNHPLVSHFLHNDRWLRPICRSCVPSWDFSVVLEGLLESQFEPLESALEKTLSMVLNLFKREEDLQALSVASYCLDCAPGLVKVILH